MDENERIKNNGNYYKSDVIAQLFGVTVRRIQQLTQDGVLQTTQTPSGRRYDLVPTIQRYVKYLSEKANGKTTKNGVNIELQNQKVEADIALKQSQNELHKLKADILNGDYLPKEEVQLDYRRFFIVFKKFCQSIPSRVSGYLNGIDPTQIRIIESELSTEIANLLNGFAIAGMTSDTLGDQDKAKKTKQEKSKK